MAGAEGFVPGYAGVEFESLFRFPQIRLVTGRGSIKQCVHVDSVICRIPWHKCRKFTVFVGVPYREKVVEGCKWRGCCVVDASPNILVVAHRHYGDPLHNRRDGWIRGGGGDFFNRNTKLHSPPWEIVIVYNIKKGQH